MTAAGPALILFDDAPARAWRPFTLTRPAGELLFGTMTLRARAARALGLECIGHVTSPWLADYDESRAPPVLDPARLPRGRPLVFLSSRAVLESQRVDAGGAAVLRLAGHVVGCVVPAGAEPPAPAFFARPDDAAPDLPALELEGAVLGPVWDLMTGNAERTARDLSGASAPRPDLAGVHVLGDGPVVIDPDVEIAPGVVLDTRAGPIRLERGVKVRPFSHIIGPTYVGPGSTLLGGPYERVSIGPVCRVHGEIEESVVLGYSNKAHDGFLGHAYLGMWVNLGALTTNSDLKNNYGLVRLWTPAGEVDTGERKIGAFIGDHVKTAIGTMLNTGTVIEAGSNVFGGMPPKYVPPFSWGTPDTVYEFDKFIATAVIAAGRRDVQLSERHQKMLAAAWNAGRGK